MATPRPVVAALSTGIIKMCDATRDMACHDLFADRLADCPEVRTGGCTAGAGVGESIRVSETTCKALILGTVRNLRAMDAMCREFA
jgi:hypothetical protein